MKTKRSAELVFHASYVNGFLTILYKDMYMNM